MADSGTKTVMCSNRKEQTKQIQTHTSTRVSKAYAGEKTATSTINSAEKTLYPHGKE